jgi:protein-tyrosine phosphatase
VNISGSHLLPSQGNRLTQFSAEQSVDIHCHCLPGIDDGPQTIEQAIDLCRGLVADGITTVIATPHQLGAYEGENSSRIIREMVESLADQLAALDIPLTVVPGADVRVDDRLIERLSADEILTLADGHAYILLELPHDTMIDLRPLIHQLKSRGLTPILSHPERHRDIAKKPELVLPWLQIGALLQVTAGSLAEIFDSHAERAAWQLIEAGMVSLIASDAHGMERRPPAMSVAIDILGNRLGHAVARRLCIENPHRVLQGEPIVPPRMSGRSALRRGGS